MKPEQGAGGCMNETPTCTENDAGLTQADLRSFATDIRRKQHARSKIERRIHDNMIQILQPKGRFNTAMAPNLLRRQMRNLSPRQ